MCMITATKSKCVEMKSAMKMSSLVVIIGYILFSSILWISNLRSNGDNVITEQHHAHRKLWKIHGIDVNDPHTTGLRKQVPEPPQILDALDDVPVTMSISLLDLLSNFKDASEPFEQSDIPMFWHIPKNGGSSIKRAMGGCHRFVMACESGVIGHETETKIAIVVEDVHLTPYVNIDTTTPTGISRAKSMGFADSHLANVVVSPLLFETNELFTQTAKGRLFSIFRHPIARAISMFYYLRVADWEPTYSPEMKEWTIEQYAVSHLVENNWVTRMLSNQFEGELTNENLIAAKEVVRTKFIVGLMSKMEPSMARFEKVFHWKYHVNPHTQEPCRERLLSSGENINESNKEYVDENHPAWALLARQNNFDLKLYAYIEQLFEEQGEYVKGLPDDYRLVDATCCKCDPPTFPRDDFVCLSSFCPHQPGREEYCRMEPLGNDNTHKRKLWLDNDPHTEELRQQEPNVGTFSTTDDSSNESPNIIQPYTLHNVLQAIPYWENTISVMIYDPQSDKFILHYSKHMRWLPPCMKLVHSFRCLANSLRTLYPERFTPENDSEFALVISSADYPHIKWNKCLLGGNTNCFDGVELPPILNFGSFFQDRIVPTLIGMPMPYPSHLDCFNIFAQNGGKWVCNQYRPKDPRNAKGLIFPEQIINEDGQPVGWDDLIPQVVWRGSDFSYITDLRPELYRPYVDTDIASRIDMSQDYNEVRIAAIKILQEHYDEFLPRWKGVVWTAVAELEAEEKDRTKEEETETDHRKNRRRQRRRAQHEEEEEQVEEEVLPFCNIKFVSSTHGGSSSSQFDEIGIPIVGDYMPLEELGLYKYHIDIGGGGGTTWEGLRTKLPLPGLLFHHVTPTKDYLHDKLKPWEHYVPIREDLSDLKTKFEWAESHPEEAQAISQRATEFSRSLSTTEGMAEIFEELYRKPLDLVVESYQPIESNTQTWRDIITPSLSYPGSLEMKPLFQCGGHTDSDCEDLENDGRKFSNNHSYPPAKK